VRSQPVKIKLILQIVKRFLNYIPLTIPPDDFPGRKPSGSRNEYHRTGPFHCFINFS
jgi:hypothetical protein